MKLLSIEINNVKSFRNNKCIQFDNNLNILVGPNRGGKSNLLDIITITMQRLFQFSYSEHREMRAEGLVRQIRSQDRFADISNRLDKFSGETMRPSNIILNIKASKGDIDNITSIKNNKLLYEEILSGFTNPPFTKVEMFESVDANELLKDQILSYEFIDGTCDENELSNAAKSFLKYLRSLELFFLISQGHSEINIKPNFLYFPPYRIVDVQNLQANLSNANFFQRLINYSSSTSKAPASFIDIAALYFAEKRRNYETQAKKKGYQTLWNTDDEIKRINEYLGRLSYSLELKLIEKNQNIYDIVISRNGKDFNIAQASSGEKEILNFLFAIFAMNILGGLVVIDEPELHLHPAWQELLRDLLLDLSFDVDNQFIIATHSPVFITPETISNVMRIYYDKTYGTNAIEIDNNNKEDSRSLLHIVNTHNNEKMFFADKIVLVEGVMDRIIFKKLLDIYKKGAKSTEVIEVLEVHGKDNLKKYKKFLNSFEVNTSIIADLDYALSLDGERIKSLCSVNWKKINKNVLMDKKSKDRIILSKRLETAIKNNDLIELKYIWQYIKNRHVKLRNNLSPKESDYLSRFMSKMYKEQIYILRKGELEDYLPEGVKSLENIIEFVKDEPFLKWLSNIKGNKEIKEMEKIVCKILGIERDTIKEIRSHIQKQYKSVQ